MTSKLSSDERWFQDIVTGDVSSQTDLHEFSTTTRLDHLIFDSPGWSALLSNRFGDRSEESCGLVQGIYEVSWAVSRPPARLTSTFVLRPFGTLVPLNLKLHGGH